MSIGLGIFGASRTKAHEPSAAERPGVLTRWPIRVRPLAHAVDKAQVSVVIPCFNYARFLPLAAASALSQEGVEVDLIIVDDRSADDSLAIAQRLAAAHEQVTVIAHAVNSGPVETFNDGLAAAKGEFVVRLDADDMLTPGALLRAVRVMRAFPRVGLVYGHPLHFSGDVLPVARAKATGWTVWPGRVWLADRCRVGTNVITSPEVVMRRSVVDRVGGQQPLAHTHDMEMWLRIAAFCDVAYIQGVDQAWHREHSNSLSARKVDTMRDLLERRSAFETLFAGCVGKIEEAETLRLLAMTAIASDAIELAARQFDRPGMNPTLVESYLRVAQETVADIKAVSGYRSLAGKLRLGPRWARWSPFFFAERLLRGALNAWRRRRWHRLGV